MNAHIDFSLLVREIRQVLGLTQEQLAHELGVTFGTVNGWENGKHRPIPVLAHRLLEMGSSAGITPRQAEVLQRRGTLRKAARSRRKG